MVKAFLKTIGRREYLKSSRMRYISSGTDDDDKAPTDDVVKMALKVSE